MEYPKLFFADERNKLQVIITDREIASVSQEKMNLHICGVRL